MRTASRRNSSVYLAAILTLLHSKHCSKETGTKPWQDHPEFEREFAGLRRSLIREVEAGSTMLELYRRENPTMQFMDGDPTGYSAMLGSFSQFESDHAGSSKPIEVFNVEEERRQEKLEQAQRKREQAVRERQQEEDQRKKAEAERAVWTAHHALLDEEAERRQADARKKAEDENVNLADYANAEIAIKYSQEAEEAWAQITNFPADLRRLFLTALDKDPRKDVPKLLSLVEGELKKGYVHLLTRLQMMRWSKLALSAKKRLRSS